MCRACWDRLAIHVLSVRATEQLGPRTGKVMMRRRGARPSMNLVAVVTNQATGEGWGLSLPMACLLIRLHVLACVIVSQTWNCLAERVASVCVCFRSEPIIAGYRLSTFGSALVCVCMHIGKPRRCRIYPLRCRLDGLDTGCVSVIHRIVNYCMRWYQHR